MKKVEESDWKLFCELKDVAIERYGQRCLEEYREILEDDSKKAINRHALLHRISDNLNRKYNLLFKGHSRSKLVLQLLAIRGEKLIDETELKSFSEEILVRTDPKRVNW